MGKRIPVTVCGTKYRTITECCNALGVRINTVYKKLQSDKSITLEQAILQSIPDIYEVDGKIYKTLKAIAEDYNLSYETLRSRIELGWTVHDAVYMPIDVILSSNYANYEMNIYIPNTPLSLCLEDSFNSDIRGVIDESNWGPIHFKYRNIPTFKREDYI